MRWFGRSEQRHSPNPLNYAALIALQQHVAVTEANAVKRSLAVHRSVAVTAGAVASLPWKAYRDTKDGRVEVPSSLLLNPHRSLTVTELKELMAVHLLTYGNFFGSIEVNGAGVPVYLDVLDPLRCSVRQVIPSPMLADGRLYIVTVDGGEAKEFTSNEILHIPNLSLDGVTGLSPIGAARVTAAGSIAAEKYAASLWESGNLASGFLEAEGDVTEDEANKLKERFAQKVQGLSNAHDVPVLSGVKFTKLTLPNEDSQFIESRKFDAAAIYQMFGLSSEGVPPTAHDWLKFTLLPLLNRIEDRMSRLLPRGQFCEFVTEGLLRADTAIRYASYAVGLQNGFLSLNDVEGFENMPLTPGGDKKERLAPNTGTPNAQVEPNRKD